MKRLLLVLALLAFALAPALSFGATFVPTTTKQEILKGLMLASHTYKVAWYTSSATCTASFGAAYTVTNEVGTAGGYDIGQFTTGTSGTAGTIEIFSGDAGAVSSVTGDIITFPSLTFATPAACGIIYDDTHATNQVLAVFPVSPPIQPTAEDVTLNLSSGYLLSVD